MPPYVIAIEFALIISICFHRQSISVEAVDEVFQTKMMEMLSETGRNEVVVGWYHSHPGMGCFLSGVDIEMQHGFERLHKRSVAVVVDPIQSVRGKVSSAYHNLATLHSNDVHFVTFQGCHRCIPFRRHDGNGCFPASS